MNSITSPQNEKFKTWLSLLDSKNNSKKGIKRHQLFILSGPKVVNETLLYHQNSVVSVLHSEKNQPDRGQTQHYQDKHFLLENKLFKELDVFGTDSTLLVCQTPTLHLWDSQSSPEGLEILCPLGDPRNLGAVVRTCAAFGVSKLILLQESCSVFLPKSLRAASGQIWNVPLYQGPSLHDMTNGSSPNKSPNNHSLTDHVLSLDMHGENIHRFQWPKNCRLLIGEEGQGVPRNLKTQPLSIPMEESVESLNAAHCISIALSSYYSQHK